MKNISKSIWCIGFIIITVTIIICISVSVINCCINHFFFQFPNKIIYNGTKIIPYNETDSYKADIKDSELAKIVFTKCNQSLEKGAFWGYAKLQYIELPSGLNKIPDFAFTGCTSLETITIPKTVETIGKGVFLECIKLKEINNFDQLKLSKIHEDTFAYCKNLENIELPSTITSIGTKAFLYCEALETITIPQTVGTIGIDAFLGCNKIVLDFQTDDEKKVKKLLKEANVTENTSIIFQGAKSTVKEFVTKANN